MGIARRDNIEIAAAMTVMGRDAVGIRRLCLENAWRIPAGIYQLAAGLVDEARERSVCGAPERMWRDLLGHDAVRQNGVSFTRG